MVEGTAGNTGIGLAHMCNALGYKCVIFMPDTQSKVGVVQGYVLVSQNLSCGYGSILTSTHEHWTSVCVCVCVCVCVLFLRQLRYVHT